MLGILVALGGGRRATPWCSAPGCRIRSTGRLPPDALSARLSWRCASPGLAFGAGMAISGSCVSAHLYRLGEGSPTAPFALVGTVAGFALGFHHVEFALPRQRPGGAGDVAAAHGLAIPGRWSSARDARASSPSHCCGSCRREATPSGPRSGARNLRRRWPAWVGRHRVGAIGVAAYLRVAPLGVTAELGARASQAPIGVGVLAAAARRARHPARLRRVVRDARLRRTGCSSAALVLASFAAALAADQFRPAWPTGESGRARLGRRRAAGLGRDDRTRLHHRHASVRHHGRRAIRLGVRRSPCSPALR